MMKKGIKNFCLDLDFVLSYVNSNYSVSDRPSPLHDPIRLFHYTNPDAAWKILSSGKIWLTNIATMNDSSEVDYFLACMSAPIGIKDVKYKIGPFRKSISLNDWLKGKDPQYENLEEVEAFEIGGIFGNEFEYRNILKQALEKALDWRDHFDIYIGCLSEGSRDYWKDDYYGIDKIPKLGIASRADLKAADDLVLWRGYAADGKGAAVEIGRGDLCLHLAFFYDERITQNHLKLLMQMSEDYAINKKILEGYISKIKAFTDGDSQAESYFQRVNLGKDICTMFRNGKYLFRINYASSYEIMDDSSFIFECINSCMLKNIKPGQNEEEIITILSEFFVLLACCHKHPGFISEKEWRVVEILPKSKQSRKNCSNDRNPDHLEFDIGFNRAQLSNSRSYWPPCERVPRLPQEVVLGPASTMDDVPSHIAKMVEAGKINIQSSTIPYVVK